MKSEIVRPVEVHVEGGSPEADLAHDTHLLCHLSHDFEEYLTFLQRL